MAMARKGSVIQSKLGMILYGEQFTGKSTMAMQLAYFKRPDGKPFRILYLDAETGSIDDYLPELEANGVNLGNIYIVYTQSLGEVRQYIAKVKNHEDMYVIDEDGNETMEVVTDADGEPFRADAIVVDGTTILNLSVKTGLMEFSKKRNRVKATKEGLVGEERLVKIEGAGLELKDYNTINFKGQDLILDLMGCGVHYIATARETDEKVSVKDQDGKITSVSTGRKKPDGFKGMEYNAKTVIRMYRDEDGSVCAHIEKDRTHIHEDNEVLVDPTLLSWQEVINRSADKKEYVIKNNLQQAVETEQEIYSQELLHESAPKKVPHAESAHAESEDNDEANVNELRAKCIAAREAVAKDPVAKEAMKTKLKEAGLPLAFTKVNDVETFEKILEVIGG